MKLEKILAWVIISCLVIILSASILYSKTEIYICGEYGKYCYEQGKEHKNIRYPVKFNTLEDCLNYIKEKD